MLTGPGGALGDVLVADPRVRKVSFTGSTGIGERIAARAGVKKLSLELGASCPVVIMPDADLELASSAVAIGGFANAGQVCISVQRVIAHPAINGDFLDALVPKVKAIQTGDPSLAGHHDGHADHRPPRRERVEESIAAAAKAGARILTGGERDGAVIPPAVVADVDPSSPFSQDELFGPAVAVSKADDWEAAIAQANGTAVRSRRRDLHRRRRGRGPGHPGDRRRQHPHQLDAAVARRPHALRRPEGQRHRQGRPAHRRRRDDRREDGRPARPALVTARTPTFGGDRS